jgi:hypothetical protein
MELCFCERTCCWGMSEMCRAALCDGGFLKNCDGSSMIVHYMSLPVIDEFGILEFWVGVWRCWGLKVFSSVYLTLGVQGECTICGRIHKRVSKMKRWKFICNSCWLAFVFPFYILTLFWFMCVVAPAHFNHTVVDLRNCICEGEGIRRSSQFACAQFLSSITVCKEL